MLTLLAVAAALTAAQPAPPAEITFDHLLVLPPPTPPARIAFRADPVLASIAAGEWPRPAAGDHAGKLEWKSITPDASGLFSDRALTAGYAYASFVAPDDAIMLLEAAGHTMVYADGEPRTGDPYENGSVRLPIRVHKGDNSLLFLAGRGHLRAKLTAPPASVFISAADPTMPDVLRGEDGTTPGEITYLGAVVVVNATDQWQRGLYVVSFGPGATEPVRSSAPDIPPLSVRKVPVTLLALTHPEGNEVTFECAIESTSGNAARVPFKCRVRASTETHSITFRSDIDGTVQSFGFTPQLASGGASVPPALFISLHGAGVDSTGQAGCYSRKDWGNLAAPTNRRSFGFDWEDWGRLDMLEVLAIATEMTQPDPARIYLTGHSMGGHGTWLNGATYPDKFAAIAPSAGWSTFWSYGGADHFDKDPSPTEVMFGRAQNPGDTIGLARNLVHNGVYVLHGDADDNVPISQARTMRKLLAEFHPDFAYHEQPGAGHWWGNQCMDWPPLFEFLRGHTRRPSEAVTQLHFTTANPAVSASCFWATIVQQQVQSDFSSVDLNLDAAGATIKGSTTNVACLAVDVAACKGDTPITVEIDGVKLEGIARPPSGPLYLKRADTWQVAAAPPAAEKNPRRAGPFKHAFNRHTVLVYGTRGSPAETAWMLAKARFDAETIYYRGNGAFDIVPDTAFSPGSFPDRSVMLYGNADINAAWATLLAGSALDVREGVCRVGGHEYTGATYAALFVRPRADAADALIGAVAFTGLNGAYATQRIPYFTSGIAFPDWAVFSTRVCADGMKGVDAAGFFNNDWTYSETQSAFASP